jgi:hypothetical protein
MLWQVPSGQIDLFDRDRSGARAGHLCMLNTVFLSLDV